MSISDADLDALIKMLDRGRQSWIEGGLDAGDHGMVAQDEGMTIFGPFGGEAGGGPGLGDRQRQAASLFHGGTGECEVVRTIISGDLAVVVLIERNEVVVEGSDAGQPWVLRTTQVFEKRTAGWVRLHRHADPLISRRSPTETFSLARS